MKYNRFEDLPVWKAALDLAIQVYTTTEDRAFSAPGDLRDQIRRAALSVSNNTAGGFERGSTSELLMYLYIARGSAGEVRSMLCFCDRWPATAHLKSQIRSSPARCPGSASSAPSSRTSPTRHHGLFPLADPLPNPFFAGIREKE